MMSNLQLKCVVDNARSSSVAYMSIARLILANFLAVIVKRYSMKEILLVGRLILH